MKWKRYTYASLNKGRSEKKEISFLIFHALGGKVFNPPE
jgi:hypothetical protein